MDYGRRRLGLAISDPSGTIATGLDTLTVKATAEAVDLIVAGRSEWEYTRIVVGLPLLTSGEPGDMAAEVLAFVEDLREACGVPVLTLDERFTSREAERILHQMGQKIKGNKGTIDRISAEILLRDYLDRNTPDRGFEDE